MPEHNFRLTDWGLGSPDKDILYRKIGFLLWSWREEKARLQNVNIGKIITNGEMRSIMAKMYQEWVQYEHTAYIHPQCPELSCWDFRTCPYPDVEE